jgi:regulatory protein
MSAGPEGTGEDSQGAFARACRYLTARERCAAEVRTYLRKHGFAEEEIESAIRLLQERRYVDDLRYARLYVESRSRRAPRAGALLVKELRRRGVDAETARSAVGEFLRRVPEEELARRLIAKLPGEGEEWKERAARKLRARGFRPSIALRGHVEPEEVWDGIGGDEDADQ